MRSAAAITVLVHVLVGHSLGAQGPALEYNVIAYGIPTTRDAAVTQAGLSSADGMMAGLELSVRRAWVGVTARLISGDMSTSSVLAGSGGKLTCGDLRIQIGSRMASLDVGYAMRASAGTLGTTSYSFLRAGGSTIIDIGGTGLAGRITAGVYFGGSGPAGVAISGQEIMTALEYRIAGSPWLLMVGYRSEVFQASAGGQDRAEHVSGVLIGAGFRLQR